MGPTPGATQVRVLPRGRTERSETAERPETGDTGLSSVANAARLLREFTVERPELGVSELARRLGVGKSTAHRLVTTLSREGLVDQDPVSGRYRLSVVVHALGQAVPFLRDLHCAAAPVVDAVRARTKETVLVGVRRGRDVLITERAESGFGVALFRRHGYAHPADRTAVGRVLLAELPSNQVNALLADWQTPDPGTVAREVELVRRRGYAICVGEVDAAAATVAAPIRDQDGCALAGLAIVVPTERLTAQAQRNLGILAVEAANTISGRLAPQPEPANWAGRPPSRRRRP
jgi:DNA-binding IclR family transcriptional regulator